VSIFEQHSLPLSFRSPCLASASAPMAFTDSFPASTTTATSDSEEVRCSATGRGQWTQRAVRTTGSSQTPPRMPPAAADRSVPSLTEGVRSRWLPAVAGVAVHAPRGGSNLASYLARSDGW
jgi:hypothetical protein